MHYLILYLLTLLYKTYDTYITYDSLIKINKKKKNVFYDKYFILNVLTHNLSDFFRLGTNIELCKLIYFSIFTSKIEKLSKN